MCVRDWTGVEQGRLTVLRRAQTPTGKRGAHWLCRCECGREYVVRGSNLARGVRKCARCSRNSLARDAGTTLREIAASCGVPSGTLSDRLKKGMSIQEATSIATRRAIRITALGVSGTIAELSRHFGLTERLVRMRLWKGWDVDDALTRPVRPKRKTAAK